MSFVSVEFVIFFIVVFFLYWFVFHKHVRLQNLFLLVVSYIFYGWIDWRFLLLISTNAIIDFIVGKQIFICKSDNLRKIYLAISLLVNLGLLAFFKYFNFFCDGVIDFLNFFGFQIHIIFIKLFVPAAISYYTLQTMSYSIDVYKRKIVPEKDIIAFLAYIAFFPKLLSGPIERSYTLLPQFLKRRSFVFERAQDGIRQILWGLFKKVVIADKLSEFVNDILANYPSYSGSTLLVGIILFSFQIYADFSGYSDIAIGTGKLLGFDIMQNFSYPYFSKSIAEFWRRWHISFSTWLRDYIFLPLSFHLSGKMKKERYFNIRTDKIINTIATPVTFVLCGLWHGANYTFLIWGFLFGLYLIPQFYKKKRKKVQGGWIGTKSIKGIYQTLFTFLLVSLTWVFFTAPDISHAFLFLGKIFSLSLFSTPKIPVDKLTLFLILVLFIAEFFSMNKQHPLQFNHRVPVLVRWPIYTVLLILILSRHITDQVFIYSQF
jgi:alginate O-acetyltransferase complex protein AlgI